MAKKENNEKLVLGLMSGTSLDGLDLALCRFYTEMDAVRFDLLANETTEYPYFLKEKLNDALHLSPKDLHDLNLDLGKYFAEKISVFINKTGIQPDLIASHGHTVLHQPDKGITLQIGDGYVMAQDLRMSVINDFRIQDVSKGGQGAPLVPIGDRDLFKEYNFCLNLGGIANISYDINNSRIACDICPCNMALNTITSWIGISYDENGEKASKGNIHTELLEKLNSLNYYKMPPPKSLGKEWFLHEFLPVLRNTRISIEDILRTVNEHISVQISTFIKNTGDANGNLLISGGGTYNNFLISLLKNKLDLQIIIPDKNIIDFKEAIVFAYLGYLRDKKEINVLSSVTGATSDTSAGIIYNPN